MVTTPDRIERPNFVQHWMQQAAGIVTEPDPEPEPEPAATDEYGEYVTPIVDRRKNWAAAHDAILSAVGVDIAEPPAIEQRPVPEPPSQPQMTPAPVQVAELPTEPPAGVPGQAERHARTWRERVGLPRRKEKLSPVHTTAGRRERYARDKAARTGMSFDEAMASIVQRPETTRYGRRKAIAEARAGALTDGTSLDA